MSQPITENWLLEDQGNPWQLTSKQMHNSPYPFIANGYISQQIPPEGQGMLTPQVHCSRSGSLIHGLYNEQPLPKHILEFAHAHFPKDHPLTQQALAEIPLWSTLQLGIDNIKYTRANGCHKNYQQTLDLKTATVTTKDTWTATENKTVKVNTKIYLSYADKNLAIITTEFTPNFNGEIYFEDIIDASIINPLRNINITTGEINTLTAQTNTKDNTLLIASKIITTENPSATTTIEKNSTKINRKITFHVTAKQKQIITKLVAIYTNQDGDTLPAQATTLLNKASENLVAFRKAHTKTWHKLWQHRIEIDGAPGLQKLTNTVLYQCYCQLRKGVNWSLGPTGISGSMQWAGIIFWDADLWIGPPLMLLNPTLARCIYQYRHRMLAGAKRNAQAKSYAGARFPWESTDTGDETCFAYTAEQDHIVADIALTQWQYYLVTQDKNYRQKMEEIILACADYWTDRIVYNQNKDRYEIHNVCCADEYSGIVNNNTYTNYSAVKTLEIASTILKQQQKTIPIKWQQIINKMHYPYDKQKDLFLEYENYNGETIKQADTALLIYPYAMPLSKEQKNNIVEYYRHKYPHEKIMMGSAFDGIIYCEQQKPEKAWQALLDLLPHFLGPFLLPSETPTNNVFSFMTGIGGFLQLIINGFAGIRINTTTSHPEPTPTLRHPALDAGSRSTQSVHYSEQTLDSAVKPRNDVEQLTINPCLPKQISAINLIGIHDQGENKTIEITREQNHDN
ncbi:MAG: glycoside hydrolase family 65 protein [Gammaproteobacteria bacterium]|nr:glycoside hydrolase family 65 protein [Gammaproteobacteria bacterium]